MVFSSCGLGNGLSNSAVAKLLERMGRTDCTIHGCRSTFMDWCQQQTSFPKAVIDQSLPHVTGDKVEAA
jgi:mannitol-1-phosphate/altronate dehydrogenase